MLQQCENYCRVNKWFTILHFLDQNISQRYMYRIMQVVLELEFYLFDRQSHNIGEIISKCEIILSGDSHKGTNWPLT